MPWPCGSGSTMISKSVSWNTVSYDSAQRELAQSIATTVMSSSTTPPEQDSWANRWNGRASRSPGSLRRLTSAAVGMCS